MKYFFYIKNGEKIGPFTKQALQAENIERNTLVWFPKLKDWTELSRVEELGDLVKAISPTIKTTPYSTGTSYTSENKKNIRKKETNYLLRHWRGELSLTTSFWGNTVLAYFLMLFTMYLFGYALISKSQHVGTFNWFFITLSSPIVGTWLFVGIWRSSRNRLREKKYFFSILTRILSILSIILFLNAYFTKYLPNLVDHIEFSQLTDDISWNIQISENGEEIELSGGIGNGISNDLEAYIANLQDIKYIHLNLERGGLVKEAFLLSNIIRKNNLSTVVSSECSSACTIAFLGGEQRIIKKFARLGFHSHSYPGLDKNQTFIKSSKQIYLDLNVSPKFVDEIFNTPKNGMWYPSENELIDGNIVTKIVNGDDFNLTETESDINTEILKGIYKRITDMSKLDQPEIANKALKEHNRVAKEINLADFAISELSIKYNELNDLQNEIGTEGEKILSEVRVLNDRIEKRNLDYDDEKNFPIIWEYYRDFCNLSKKNINAVERIINILDKKILLALEPEVLSELFKNDSRSHEFLILFRDQQQGVLTSEKQSFDESCSDFLVNYKKYSPK
jgi:hypothetical protein